MKWFKPRLLFIPCVAAVGMGLLFVPRGTGAPPALEGSILPGDVAPAFRLLDAKGHVTALTQLRGRPVVLTFVEARCKEQCPLVVDKIRSAELDVERQGGKVGVLAISVDPEGDTPSAMQQFSKAHGMLGRWRYLTGSRAQLANVWHAYYVYAAPAGASAALRDRHVSATYLLDSKGRERVLFAGNPDQRTLTRDLRILAGLAPDVAGRPLAAPQAGYPAPPIRLSGVNGGNVRLADLRGKVVLVNFWATTCPPCRSEMPLLGRWYRRFAKRGLVVLGIDKQEGRQTVRDFTQSLHVPYPVALDTGGETASRYDLYGLPASFVIDRNGMVRSVRYGVIDPSYLTANLTPLLRSAA